MQRINKLVNILKDNNEDFEFYPTNNEIINIIKAHLDGYCSVFDCGAGNGETLNELTTGKN